MSGPPVCQRGGGFVRAVFWLRTNGKKRSPRQVPPIAGYVLLHPSDGMHFPRPSGAIVASVLPPGSADVANAFIRKSRLA